MNYKQENATVIIDYMLYLNAIIIEETSDERKKAELEAGRHEMDIMKAKIKLGCLDAINSCTEKYGPVSKGLYQYYGNCYNHADAIEECICFVDQMLYLNAIIIEKTSDEPKKAEIEADRHEMDIMKAKINLGCLDAINSCLEKYRPVLRGLSKYYGHIAYHPYSCSGRSIDEDEGHDINMQVEQVLEKLDRIQASPPNGFYCPDMEGIDERRSYYKKCLDTVPGRKDITLSELISYAEALDAKLNIQMASFNWDPLDDDDLEIITIL